MLVRSFFFAGLAATSLALSACSGADAIEFEPDDKEVQRAPPSWTEPGATAPTPVIVVMDAGTDASADASSDAAADAPQASDDAAVTDAPAATASADASDEI